MEYLKTPLDTKTKSNQIAEIRSKYRLTLLVLLRLPLCSKWNFPRAKKWPVLPVFRPLFSQLLWDIKMRRLTALILRPFCGTVWGLSDVRATQIRANCSIVSYGLPLGSVLVLVPANKVSMSLLINLWSAKGGNSSDRYHVNSLRLPMWPVPVHAHQHLSSM